MDIETSPQAAKKQLNKVPYGSCVYYEGTHWILSDSYPECILVGIKDGNTRVFSADNHWPKVRVLPKAVVTLNPTQ